MNSSSGILHRRLASFDVSLDSVSVCADSLRRLGFRVCSFENLPAIHGNPVTLNDDSLEEVLNAIIARNPGYRWDMPLNGLINLYPVDSILNLPVPDISVRSKGGWRILEDNLHIAALGLSLFIEFGDPDGPAANLELEHADLRTALNTIVYQFDSLVWHITGQHGTYYLSFTEVP